MRSPWYDKTGRPIDAATASDLLGDRAYTRVARTRVTSRTDSGHDYLVSTVWLGIDYSHTGGTPILFETMVFADPKSFVDTYMRRYHTLDEATAGHAETVTLVAATVPDEMIEDNPPDGQ